MSGKMEFSDLNQPGGSSEDGYSSAGSATRPADLPTDGRPQGKEANSGTPLRETAQSKDRKESLRTIVVGFGLFSIGVTVALLVQIIAGSPQIEPHGAVATVSKVCAEMGVDQLKAGGNAVDAALTTMLCVGLVTPQYAGIGGGGFIAIHDHKTHRSHFMDFREVAPKALPEAMPITEEDLKKGKLGVGVPGEIAGIWNASQTFGKLSWKQLFAPVIALARKGFPVGTAHAVDIKRRENMKHLEGVNEQFKTLFMDAPEAGKLWRRPEYADVLEKIADAEDGHAAFYSGEVAESIVSATDGHITLDDLRNYQVKWREPVRGQIGEYTVESFPAPGSGPILIRMLQEIERELKKEKVKFQSAQYYKLLAKVFSEVTPCRNHLGDPVGPDESTSQFQARMIDPNSNETAEKLCESDAASGEKRGTSQVSVIDKDELMVSATTSMNYWFGSLLVTDSGILLNNEMADFSTDETSPNRIEEGKRPMSGMSPTVVFNTKEACKKRFAIGGVNGTKIVAGVAEVTANLILFDQKLRASLRSPRVHCDEQKCSVSDLKDAGDDKDAIIKQIKIGSGKEKVEVAETLNLVGVVLHYLNESVQAMTDEYQDWGGASY